MSDGSAGFGPVGFIGLGVMGRPMAKNLLKAGFQVVVHSRSHPPVEELVADGATGVTTPRKVAERAAIIVTMLPDSSAVRAVVLDPNVGVISGADRGHLVIDMSTIEPTAARALGSTLEASGMDFLDAPVSGGERGAIDGSLSIMVGGDWQIFDRVTPILWALGQTIVHIGETGAGQIAKACNQLVVAANIEAVAEALGLARRAGIDPAVCRQVLMGGFAGSRVLDVHGERMLARDYRPGFRVRLHAKDARIIRDLVATVHAATPSFEIASRHLSRLLERGDGELDHSALLEIVDPLDATDDGAP